MQPASAPVADDRSFERPRTSRALLTVAWLVVGIPAAWGVSQTVMRSMDLFTSPAPAPTTVPTAGASR